MAIITTNIRPPKLMSSHFAILWGIWSESGSRFDINTAISVAMKTNGAITAPSFRSMYIEIAANQIIDIGDITKASAGLI